MNKAMTDKIYTRAELRTIGMDTSAYRFLQEVGDFTPNSSSRQKLAMACSAPSFSLRTAGTSSRPSSGGSAPTVFGRSRLACGSCCTTSAALRAAPFWRRHGRCNMRDTNLTSNACVATSVLQMRL